MLEFRPFRAGHFRYVRPHASQSADFEYLMQPELAGFLENDWTFSGWAGHRCVGAAGIVSQGGGRGEAWLLLTDDAKRHAKAVIKQALHVLDTCDFRRVDMTVKVGNSEGEKIARLLKFKKEAVLEAWHPDGSSVTLYTRIKR